MTSVLTVFTPHSGGCVYKGQRPDTVSKVFKGNTLRVQSKESRS